MGTSFMWPGPLKLRQPGTILENRLIRGLGTSTKFRLFTLSIRNYSAKMFRCLVVHLGHVWFAISLIHCYYKLVPCLI